MKNYFKVLANSIASVKALCFLFIKKGAARLLMHLTGRFLNGLICKRMHGHPIALAFLFILAGPFSLLAQSDFSFNIQHQRQETQIPFQNVNNLIIVSVLLDNLVPLNFLVDTGVRTAILTDRFYSDLLSINYDRKLSIRGAGNLLHVEAYVASNVAFKVSDVQAQGQTMLVLQDDYLELSAQLGIPVHGILGYDFFRHFVIKIDYEAQVITLYDPVHFKPPGHFDHFPLTIEDTKPYINLALTDVEDREEIPVKLMLDTGASHGLLLHHADSCSRFVLPEKTIYGTLGRGLVGDVVGHIGRVQKLAFSKKYTFQNVLTSFPEENTYNYSADMKKRDGTIGGELLHRFTVILDYNSQRVYLKKNKHYSRPFIFSKTGFTITAEGTGLNTFKVVQVRENSPAEEAGIKVGDVIMRLNGTRAKNLTLMSIQDKLKKKDGKKIRFRMKRGEEEYVTSFRLRNII